MNKKDFKDIFMKKDFIGNRLKLMKKSKLIKKNNITFKERYIPEINIEQLFFKDPAGNGIELIFLDKS